MDAIGIITPTSDRPYAFQLCERWMKRALAYYGRSFVWYVIDDGQEPAHCSMGQIHIRRSPCPSAKDSFLGNLLAGLNRVREDKIIFIEDDDWYAEDYIAFVVDGLDEATIVGEARAKYYSLPFQSYYTFENAEHASLCQTAIRRDLLDWFEKCVAVSETPFVDIPLWTDGAAGLTKKLMLESRHCIGMKGLPGRTGISGGHVEVSGWASDDNGHVLRSWIGVEDASVYIRAESHCEFPDPVRKTAQPGISSDANDFPTGIKSN